MLSKEEAERVAAMANVLRADWSPPSVMAVLADPRIRERRTFPEVAVALAVIATDPDSRRPTRLLEHGPWWDAALVRDRATPVPAIPPDACATCWQPQHVHDHVATYGDHPYIPKDLHRPAQRKEPA